MEPEEKNKTDLPTVSKWQIGLFLWLKALSRGCGLPQGERERKVKHFSLGPPQGIPKGAALGAPLVTFPATGKSPGVEGRSALLVGAGTTVPQRPPGWRGGAPSWWVQGLPSRKGPRGGGAERPSDGCRDYRPAKAPGVEGRSVHTWEGAQRMGRSPSSHWERAPGS